MHSAAAFAGRPVNNKREWLVTSYPGPVPEIQIWEETPEKAALMYNYYQRSKADMWYGLYVRRPGEDSWTYYSPEHSYHTRGETKPVPPEFS